MGRCIESIIVSVFARFLSSRRLLYSDGRDGGGGAELCGYATKPADGSTARGGAGLKDFRFMN
ncbi:hypothetical protein [Lacrimispora sp.]|uniref:hypothetical protein n=1 Tax=Lacrimispora sp. TaxID=2719234 RepID=UPI00289DE089|nr:hypothetical protein [Lacrimispora sp.]